MLPGEENMKTHVTWHSHSNFQITACGVSVLIDPFFTHNTTCTTTWDTIQPPDLVLITHDHPDHVGDAIAICKATGALCGCIVGTATKLILNGMPENLIIGEIGFNIGGTVEIKGIRITMTQAFHSADSGFPAGYIVRMPNNFTFYHAGDTGIFQTMKTFGKLYTLDLGLLPIGGFFTMDAYQAAYATKMLKCKNVIPMHWGTFPVLEQNTKTFENYLKEFSPDCNLISMNPNTSIEC